MNQIVFAALCVILGLFTLVGAVGVIVGIINVCSQKGPLGGIPLGLSGLIIGLGGFFLLFSS